MKNKIKIINISNEVTRKRLDACRKGAAKGNILLYKDGKYTVVKPEVINSYNELTKSR